jgi:putative Mg2+ transporter-C (MgtC) family protein
MSLDVDWPVISYNLILMGLAYALALPAGWNRERSARSAGLRTYPLVAIASCGFMLVGMSVLSTTDAEARVLQGIITGIGFIGGGAILKGSKVVSGTATAASLWTTGAIGVAVAFRRLEVAMLLSIITFATLQLIPSVKPLVDSDQEDDDKS